MGRRSVGEQNRGRYHTAEAGVQGVIKYGGFDFYLGASRVDSSHGIRSSWGVYPFFNNRMSYDFSSAGEQSFLLGVGYDFSRVGIEGFKADLKGATGLTEDAGPTQPLTAANTT